MMIAPLVIGAVIFTLILYGFVAVDRRSRRLHPPRTEAAILADISEAEEGYARVLRQEEADFEQAWTQERSYRHA